MIFFDFETEAIQPRPYYPPRPVGFSVLRSNESQPVYYAFNHPTGNNVTEAEALQVLKDLRAEDGEFCFHNAKFDLDVWEAWSRTPLPNKIHDTLIMAFLYNPYSTALGLKETADEVLHIKNTEQRDLRDLVIEDIPEARRAPSTWGAYIGRMPGDKVASYANGDVSRTRDLFEFFKKSIDEQGMQVAYQREIDLIPVLRESEKNGIRVDFQYLLSLKSQAESMIQKFDEYIRQRLNAPALNIDSDAEFAEALGNAGLVTNWIYTAKGRRSVAKDALKKSINDKKFHALLMIRNKFMTSLNTFILPWIETAAKSGGFIYTSWNQVRGSTNDSSMKGARTGRLSSTPNLQNVVKPLSDTDWKEELAALPEDFPAFEQLNLRRAIIGFHDNDVIVHKDYHSQEIRVLAHFERGVLFQAFQENPRLDMHELARVKLSKALNRELKRKPVKNLGFGLLYGMGVKKLAASLGVPEDEARTLKDVYLGAFPGIKRISASLNARIDAGMKYSTFGGRKYGAEPPMIWDGKKLVPIEKGINIDAMAIALKGEIRTGAHKRLNVLIQGSSADITKQALVNYHRMKKYGTFILTVHDEINISVPEEHALEEMAILNEAMKVPLSVELISDGKIGKSWGDLKGVEDGN